MARHAFYPRTLCQTMFTTLDNNATYGQVNPAEAARGFVQELRDLFRNGDGNGYNFNVALPSPRYRVSDIVQFFRSSHQFFAFVVRDTTKGCEWLFIESGANSSNQGGAWFYYGCIGGVSNGAEYTQHVGSSPDNTGGPSPTSRYGTAIYYNPDYATDTWDMEFDDASALTYSGGDFSHVPTWLPADTTGKANNFMPSTSWPRGVSFNFSDPTPADRFFVFDEEDGFLMACNTNAGDSDFYQVALLGDVLKTPDGSGDTYTHGTVWVQVTTPTTEAGDPSQGEGYVDGFTSAGARKYNYNLAATGPDYTRSNWFIEDGGEKKARWRAVAVSEGLNDKGWLKTSVARQLGVFGDGAHHRELWAAPSSSRPLVKLHSRFAFAYPAGVEVFPFSFATKE